MIPRLVFCSPQELHSLLALLFLPEEGVGVGEECIESLGIARVKEAVVVVVIFFFLFFLLYLFCGAVGDDDDDGDTDTGGDDAVINVPSLLLQSQQDVDVDDVEAVPVDNGSGQHDGGSDSPQ